MGGNYSYLKILLPANSQTIRIIFEYCGGYKQYIITAGNGKNVSNDNKYISYNDYYKIGDWYYYDGDSTTLNRILNNFDPKNDDIKILCGKLKAECNLEKYESTFSIISRWVHNVIVAVAPYVSIGLTVLQYLQGSPPKQDKII